MKRWKWSVLLGICLLSTSFLIYTLHYKIFGDLHFILFRGLANLAFVPIQGLVVTLIIAELFVIMSRRSKMQKMNMVIGAFFSELGTELLRFLYIADPRAMELRQTVEASSDLSAKELKALLRKLENYPFKVRLERSNLIPLRKLLTSRRGFMVRLLENPSLLENENFTDMLWAVFHMTEELDARENLENVPDSDLDHMLGDTARSYRNLFREWLSYMRHLHDNYPFLYSFAMRTSPIEPERQVEVV
jgi:hypothetical protein